LPISGAQRTVALPDVPAVAEVLPGFEVTHWIAKRTLQIAGVITQLHTTETCIPCDVHKTYSLCISQKPFKTKATVNTDGPAA